MGSTAWRMEQETWNSSEISYNIDNYNDEKNQQLHTILAIIVSVFGACCVVLVAYMIIFPANTSSTSTTSVTNSSTVASSSTQPTPITVPLIKRNSQFIEEKKVSAISTNL